MTQEQLEHISFIVEDILTNPNVDFSLVQSAGKLAAEDNYLYDLMSDYMKETNFSIKNELLSEILNYTHEVLRRASYYK